MQNIKNTKLLIERYFNLFQEDVKDLPLLSEQLNEKENIFNRNNYKGHIVGNALVFNKKNEILVIFHNKLKMYIQPGGHVDNDDISVLDTAVRELREETGLHEVSLVKWSEFEDIPIFIESHTIPENLKKDEEEHVHHDLLYVFKTENTNINLQQEEVSDYKWISINDAITTNPKSFISIALKRLKHLNVIQ